MQRAAPSSGHVGEDGVHIIQLLQHVNRLQVHLLLLFRDLDRGLGLPDEDSVGDRVPRLLQRVRNSHEVALVGVDIEPPALPVLVLGHRLQIVGACVNGCLGHRVLIGVGLHLDPSDVIEVEGDAAGLSKLQVLLVHHRPDVSSSPVVVVGEDVDDEADPAVRVDLHLALLVVRRVLARRLLQRVLQVRLRHACALGLVDDLAELCVGHRVRAARLHRHRHHLPVPGVELCLGRVSLALLVRAHCGSTPHEEGARAVGCGRTLHARRGLRGCHHTLSASKGGRRRLERAFIGVGAAEGWDGRARGEGKPLLHVFTPSCGHNSEISEERRER
mmetsp:Transcript_10992/g.26438  ORF Transcript_10992/g.26438 Transcript_10992/m.26438 type:complete len:331 (+) Transcript_10992:103-1095(+)